MGIALPAAIGYEEMLERSKRLRLRSQWLCARAGTLTEATRAARATSVTVRRAIAVPSIRGGSHDADAEIRRRLIREKLSDGRLPVDLIARGVVGPSRGEVCDRCGVEVRPPALIMKGVASLGRALRFHVDCFYLWDGECRTFPPSASEAQIRASADPRLGPL